MHPRRLDLQLAGRGRHRPRLGHAVPDHHGVAVLVALVSVLRDVLVDLGFQRCQQPASGTLAHQAIQVELEGIPLRRLGSDYAQHRGVPLPGGSSAAAGLRQPGGYAALFTSTPVHNFWVYLGDPQSGALRKEQLGECHGGGLSLRVIGPQRACRLPRSAHRECLRTTYR